MAETTIYAKLDCLSMYDNFVNTFMGAGTYVNHNVAMLTSDVYIGLYKFLETLQSQDIVELITYYSGSRHPFLGAKSGSNGKDYWDTSNAVGANAFSLWKFKPYGERGWDWYLYLQYHSGSAGANQLGQGSLDQDPKAFPSIYGNTMTVSCGVYAQAAISMNASGQTTNPWNGTINLSGNASKGNPVWSTGSSGYEVFVLPRSNNTSGSNITRKDSLMNFFNYARSNNLIGPKVRYHYYSDGHGILFMADSSRYPGALPNIYSNVTYFGPYRLIDSIQSGSYTKLSGTGSLGLMAFTNQTNGGDSFQAPLAGILPDYFITSQIGVTASTGTGYYDGGAFAVKEIGVRGFGLVNDNTSFVGVNSVGIASWFSQDVYLGTQGKTFDQMFNVYSTEDFYKGWIGTMDTPLLRTFSGYPQSHDLSVDGKRMYIALDLTTGTANTKRGITVPWDNGNTPGSFKSTREGRTVAITNYNW